MSRETWNLVDGWQFALDGRAFQDVHLPHDWAVDRPLNEHMEQGEAQGFFDRWGMGRYRRMLVMDRIEPDRRYFLDFGGVYERCSVRVNGQDAGGSGYGYTPFRLEVTRLLSPGSNLIEVDVDNTQAPVDRWYSGCGIYRPVTLVRTGPVRLDEREVVVDARFDGADAVVTVRTGTQQQVVATLDALSAEGSGELSFRVANARRWSAESPELYALTLRLKDGSDEISMRIGLREIVIDARRGMLVNGVPTKLRGVCLHQDVGCRGNAAKQEIWRERLLLLKQMGANAIRAAHHAHSGEFMDLCDELGFYVYAEPFDKWTGGLYGRYFQTDWRQDLDALVKRDRNRACVVIWGVGNEVENQAQDSMLQILAMLVDHVRSLDTRPVSYAMNPHFKRTCNVDIAQLTDIQKFVDEADDTEIEDPSERIERIARIAAHVDVIGCNYQEQWYERIHGRCPDMPILGTETYQCFMGHDLSMQNFTPSNPQLVPEARRWVLGSMVWTGIDYLGESMTWPSKGWSGAPIRTNLEVKPWFHVLKSYWNPEPMVHFAVMDQRIEDECVKPHWDAPPYAEHWDFQGRRMGLIPYRIASNCDEVRLYLNGKRFYVEAPKDYPDRIITGYLPWAPGMVRVEGYVGGRLCCCHELVTPGPAVRLGFDAEKLSAHADPGHELLLTVRALDGAGHACFNAGARVRFTIQGGAQILAVDNGCLMNHEPYASDAVSLFQGVASVQIRLNGEPGPAILMAHAEGLAHARCEIDVCVED